MKLSFNNEALKNPRIKFDNRNLIIRSFPATIYLVLVACHIIFLFILLHQPDSIGKAPFLLLLILLLFWWLYKSLNVDTTKIGLDDKLIHFKSFNPFKNIIRNILEYPTTINYSNVSQVYIVDRPIVKNTFVRSSIIIETDDPYKIEIGSFNERSMAELFLKDLKSEIFSNSKAI